MVAQPTAYRPRRSVLYLPASNERALAKAMTLPVDALILDLEDAIAPDAKEAARDAACAAVQSGAYGRRTLTIRCNGLDTPWGHADLAAAAAARPDAVVLPKVSGRAHLDAVTEVTGPDVRLWAMVETPAAVFAVREIAAHPQVDVLVVGTNDLAKELRAALVPGRAPLLPHLATILLAVAAGLIGFAVVRARAAAQASWLDLARGVGAALFLLLGAAALLRLARRLTGVGFGYYDQYALLGRFSVYETGLALLCLAARWGQPGEGPVVPELPEWRAVHFQPLIAEDARQVSPGRRRKGGRAARLGHR